MGSKHQVISPKGRPSFPAVLLLPEHKVCLAGGMVCRVSGASFGADFPMEHKANAFSISVQVRRSSPRGRKAGRQHI